MKASFDPFLQLLYWSQPSSSAQASGTKKRIVMGESIRIGVVSEYRPLNEVAAAELSIVLAFSNATGRQSGT
jgi:hypothetical protein